MKQVLLAVVVIAGLATAIVWYLERDRILSEIPPESSTATAPEIVPSTISVSVTLPFKELAAQAEKSAPRNYSGGGNGPDQCGHVLGVRICVGTKYDFNVSRGAISFQRGPNGTIRVAVPVSVDGHGGFRGDGARALDLDAKSFRAKVEAFADIGFALGPDWCPIPRINADFHWIEGAKVEIIGGVWVGISDLVEDNLRDQLNKMGKDVAESIKCDDVKKEVQKAWAARTFPVRLPNDAGSMYINVEPLGFGFSGLRVGADGANFLLMLKAAISVATKPTGVIPLALPKVETIAGETGTLTLAVPIIVSYNDLEERLTAQVVGKPITTTTPAGPASVNVRKVRVYPSGDRLVVGTLLTVHLPDWWLDTNGWIYVMAKPVSTSEGTGLKLDDLNYSRTLDNQLWNVLSVVLDATLKSQLTIAATVDLKAPIEKAKAVIVSELQKPHDDVAIIIGDPIIRLGRVVLGGKELFAEGLFNSKATIILKAMSR